MALVMVPGSLFEPCPSLIIEDFILPKLTAKRLAKKNTGNKVNIFKTTLETTSSSTNEGNSAWSGNGK